METDCKLDPVYDKVLPGKMVKVLILFPTICTNKAVVLFLLLYTDIVPETETIPSHSQIVNVEYVCFSCL